MATPPAGKPLITPAKKLMQAHPMMATPQPPTRLTVSGGRKAAPHLVQPDQHISLLDRLRGRGR